MAWPRLKIQFSGLTSRLGFILVSAAGWSRESSLSSLAKSKAPKAVSVVSASSVSRAGARREGVTGS
jgi:hypothetical protein